MENQQTQQQPTPQLEKSNIISKNPNSMGVIFLTIILVVLILINVPLIVILVVLGFAINRLNKAHKLNENKKVVLFAKIFLIITTIIILVGWLLSTYVFINETVSET